MLMAMVAIVAFDAIVATIVVAIAIVSGVFLALVVIVISMTMSLSFCAATIGDHKQPLRRRD